MKIAVMTDSTSYLSQELIDKYNIPIAPLSVTFDNGENFTEKTDINMDDFYSQMSNSQTIPTTSQPAIGEWLSNYESLREQGYSDIIVVCLSSGISGSFQSAKQAGDMVDGINIHAFDSKLATMMEGCYVLRAIEMVEQGYEPQQIIDDLLDMRNNTGAYLIVDDLKNLQKSGRITGAQAWVGTLLKMKPVLKFDDGKIVPDEKVRTKKRAIQALENKILDIVKDYDEVTLFVINGDHFEDGQALYKKLQSECPNNYQVAYSEFGPVVAAHLGSGGLGLGYVGRKIRLT
ncbi:fatty acid kinase binding subunit FakB1 [Staphylococcus simiae]|uniref:fatty acid kinase binding subunit FakB1 n=1 Tax=Staphylococcus simiae TaxID=308354 RepID=UPI001A96FBEE|nr:fatty acid kinase binding subunit FakB1 [Staphylococcus simiae]MBO1198766.1 fatty acid kinase binding subunit FakB1 [Staphylococcus simiae]MBO1200713.1 fatty acid kinase binding subunit FakB1 [Staphylococcus simiae]MBO1203226.1 fatty acid kinase binding subunit FakB1 [Staphylococcus simiae]MBO1210603.1 fatty acid kinase binding subunit FakB1 [Staphylococcus simiae]MBO1229049.1 fatty acid kinase binding subunit FakB1 [Staphylococcus simiae]